MRTAISVAIISYSNAINDPRILKQIAALENFCRITLIACGTKPEYRISAFYPIIVPPKRTNLPSKIFHIMGLIVFPITSVFSDPINKQVEKILRKEDFEVILANDMIFAICVKNKRKAKVIYDAHEYYFDSKKTLYGRIIQRAQRITFQKYSKECSDGITVSKGLSLSYEKLGKLLPKVVYNTTWFEELEPHLLADGERIRIIHHGGGLKKRNIERFIQLATLLRPGIELDLMLVISDENYSVNLKNVIAASGCNNIRIIDPVPIHEVSKKLNEYDVGLHMLWGNTLNHIHAMPNKLFEFLQGRLCVVTTPNPDMKEFIDFHEIGFTSEDWTLESMADVLNSLTHDNINACKLKTNGLASSYCAEKTQKEYYEIVMSTVNSVSGD